MRKLALPILILGLAMVSTAWAAGGPGDAAPPPATDKATTTPAASLPDAPAAAKTAATTPANTAAATAATPALESELAELRALLHQQAAEIEAQRRELADMKARLTPAATPAAASVTTAAPAGSTGAVEAYTPAAMGAAEEEPAAIHFKGMTLTPGGFFAAETVFRSRATDSDINTAFTGVPYSASNESRISETNFSGRQSRLSLLAQGKLANVKIGGYFEGDFLSAGVTSNERQSNSYTFRQRQFWAQVRFDSGWIITGGQMWSLVTETKKGMDNRTEALPMTIDAQYVAGFNWTRQDGFRIVKDFNDKFWLGFSLESAQEVVPTFHGNAANFILQNTGSASGLFNNTTNYTLNSSPDFVFKAAWEPGWGHYELFGLLRTFRSRYFPCIIPSGTLITLPAECTGTPTPPPTSFATNDTRAGGGIGGGFRVPLFDKKVDVGLKGLYGDGVGRYGSSTLPDLAVRPVGTIAPLHGGSFLGTIEWLATPKLDVYLNGGGDFVSRGYYVITPATMVNPAVTVGYGSPWFNNSGCESPIEVAPGAGTPNKAGNCTSDYRHVVEGTIGYWYRWYKGSKGTVQSGMQYSYLSLAAWSGTGANGSGVAGVFPQYNPHANDNMFFTSFRYYIP